ncbi:extracellular solute-binding protein [Jannaschia seohaensis]|uniref:Extracellular solute-binding protein n=1 Tax=Jannaschia seohaensis TaxID=475081 RepID=A0A2Y9A2J5_9RHOB|nr:extracellular solute-binding protein [Jannaschia seohaensis]PWJ21808.1 extracellular solute-binding protein [Jannaschia seohaensis]SSA38086.1 extracellular solute-binding protein [Jannaschia seohaensis]
MDRYPAAFARSASYEGETMGFPLHAHPQLFLYRADLIDEASETWDDVIRIGKELKETNPEIAPLASITSMTATARTCSSGSTSSGPPAATSSTTTAPRPGPPKRR